MVSSFWRPEHTLVLEFRPRLTTEQVLALRRHLEELVAKRFGALGRARANDRLA